MKTEELDISGKEIKGYRVIKPIGQGKFSIVYKAQRIADNQQVALKMIKIFDMMDPQQREKCLKEVRLLESLDHPHIIRYLDSCIEDNELLIAIEWAERGDLKRVIKRAQTEESYIEESRIWEYMHQLASALSHMHEKRIMHRDLKPANIFVASDGRLILGDLGLGRYLSSQTMEAYSRVGTPLYMSPEVLKGKGYDWKSDVWSLGCVVYELASLRSPFKKEDSKMSLYDLFHTINKGEFPPLPDRYSEELKQIVTHMIQVDPTNRLSVSQVEELCEIHLKTAVKKPRIDPFLVMDDIHEKLHLLDYTANFCKVYGKPPLTRIYFAHLTNQEEQFDYFYYLSYWLMSLKNKKHTPKTKDSESLLTDVKSFGVKLPENVNQNSFSQGYGETVCFIINDLLNKELIRRDFKFLTPQVVENGKNVYGTTGPQENEVVEEIDMELEDDKIIKWEKEEFLFPNTGSTNITDSGVSSEKEEDIITSSVKPEDWYEECKRVEKHLVISEPPPENWQLRVSQLSTSVAEISAFQTKTWEVLGAQIDNELQRVRRGELLMQKMCDKEVQELVSVIQLKKQLASKLKELRSVVSKQCEEFDKLKDQEYQIAKNIEQHSKNMRDDSVLSKLKQEFSKLKQELKLLEQKQEIARWQLDHYLAE